MSQNKRREEPLLHVSAGVWLDSVLSFQGTVSPEVVRLKQVVAVSRSADAAFHTGENASSFSCVMWSLFQVNRVSVESLFAGSLVPSCRRNLRSVVVF